MKEKELEYIEKGIKMTINKAKPLNQETKRAVVSYTVPDSWEVWSITLHPGCPDKPTEQWLMDHPNMWDWDDCLDRGGDEMKDLQVEEYDY